jgi:ATP synthase protein I
VDALTPPEAEAQLTPAPVPTPDPSQAGESPSRDPSSASTSSGTMQEFYQLRQELLITTLILMALIFGPVWYFYSLNTALNYLLGACTGVVYLRMLARNVEQLGRDNEKVGKTQLAVFIGVFIFATQIKQLHVLPVFLGFLTFKAAIIFYMLKTTLPQPSASQPRVRN